MPGKSLKRPILYKGELYSSPIEKRLGGPPKVPPVPYSEASKKLVADIVETQSKIDSLPERAVLPTELVVCFKMQPEFSAKSYYPEAIFSQDNSNFQLKEIGSRIWRSRSNTKHSQKKQEGKMYFVRTTKDSLRRLQERLNRSEDQQPKAFALDVRRLSSIDLLSPEEQLLGIDDDWDGGRLEAVLHPFSVDKENALNKFLAIVRAAQGNLSLVKHKQYDGGVTFISFIGNRKILNGLRGFNPLRTIHPLKARDVSKVNDAVFSPGLPAPPKFINKPVSYLGVLDGGINPNNPYFKNYTENINAVRGPEVPDAVSHAMQVTCAALYGPLNQFKNSDTLPEPLIGVKSFRVIASTGLGDQDLYDVIDAIEEVVPKNPDIKVYNISHGPEGPILDDQISRFTFALDRLVNKYDVLFCIAVGNDGEMTDYNRIQSPSDMVNGLAIGAYTHGSDGFVRAPYSCVGPGREGNKLKPDLLAFGGCPKSPIHLIASNKKERIITAGTSFSSPIVASAATQLIGNGKKIISPLVARALVIHAANLAKGSNGHSNAMGHGTLPEDIETIVTCSEKTYTLIYTGELEGDKFVKFQIPWINELKDGKATFRWTAAVLSQVDPHSPDDYTTTSIETSFHPNSQVYTFNNDRGSSKKVNIETEKKFAKELMALGYKQSSFPASASKPTVFTPEHDLRSDMKWDTLDSRRITKFASKIHDPVFHLHALTRGAGKGSKKIKYAFILSVQSEIDIYARILNKYSSLVPLNVHLKNLVPIRHRVGVSDRAKS